MLVTTSANMAMDSAYTKTPKSDSLKYRTSSTCEIRLMASDTSRPASSIDEPRSWRVVSASSELVVTAPSASLLIHAPR